MKLFTTLAVTFFSLGLFAVQLPATAASKNSKAQVKTHQVVYKKAAPETRKFAYQPAGKKKSNFFQRMASKPKEFFQRHAPVRLRNDGVPPEAYANVPRPVVEASVF